MNIEITITKMAEDSYLVETKLPNGYADAFRCNNEEQATTYARGLQDGLNLAKNAIGFVGSPRRTTA